MGIYLNPGNAGFTRALRSKIYVDKTGMIEYTNDVLGSEQGYLCVSRPRRFGKSMAANMLCAYYSRECDSEELFSGLQISKAPSFKMHLNQHDVIMINIQQFVRGAGELDNLVSYMEQKILGEIKVVYGNVIDRGETSLPNALTSVYVKDKAQDKGFIIIIDEWDCIFREAKSNERVQKSYLDFLRDLLKDRIYVKLAYMTGILPIKKYGTHSALNIFDEFSMTDSKYLAGYTGFTEEEVKILCDKYHISMAEVKKWYDGYLLDDGLHIYNPKSIVDVMHNRKFRSYWTRTETYEALKIYMDMNFDGLKDAVIAMLGGGKYRINIDKFQNDMTSFKSKDDVLTLLVHLGYLAYEESSHSVFIPNMEIADEFKNAIDGSRGWEQLAGIIRQSEALLEATLNLDERAVEEGISRAHTDGGSILSYNDENSLSCVITLAYFSARKDYTLIRELPTGKGFSDIIFLPRRASDKPAMIVELKWNQSAKGAIDQIKDKQYVQALEEYSGNLLLVGVNYDKKSKTHCCVIEKYSLCEK